MVSDANSKIPTLMSTDNAGNEVYPLLSGSPLVVYVYTSSVTRRKESLIPNDCHYGETNGTG